jgi:DNA-binding transcriptional LysR family regulator
MFRADQERKSLPPFATLRAFEAVGTLRGIRRAAQALKLDHAVVSRHIRSLEEWAGTRLIERVRGSIALTEQGARFHGRIAAALLEISDAAAELAVRAQEHRLQIWSVPGFASQWLTRHLASFQAASPDIEIEIHPTDHSPDFTRYEADIDIRYVAGSKAFSAAVVRGGVRRFELARPCVFAVTSPDCAARLGPGGTAAHLLHAPLLHEENDSQWHAWFAAHQVAVSGTIKGPRMWHADVAIEAARRGQGVALANPFLLGDDLVSGRLVNLVPPPTPDGGVTLGAYVLSTRADSWQSPAVAQFRCWIKKVISGDSGGRSTRPVHIAQDNILREEDATVELLSLPASA